jgi:hypothetical protein
MEEDWTEDCLRRMIKGTMRKLAREAIIFALLGLLAATIGIFVKLDMDDRASAKSKALEAVHASTARHAQVQVTLDFNKVQPIQGVPAGVTAEPIAPTVLVPLRNGTVLLVRRCTDWIDYDPKQAAKPLPSDLAPYQSDAKGCRDFADSKLLVVPMGNADQVAIEKDYWTAYHNSRSLTGSALASLFLGLWGFPAGLGLWVFYRLVCFAIKG